MNPLLSALAGGAVSPQDMMTPGINPNAKQKAFSAMPEIVQNPVDLQMGMDRALQDLQQAQQMQQGLPEYNNLGDVLIGAIQAYRGNKQEKDADKRYQQSAQRMFDYEQDVAQREAIKQQMQAEAERRQERAEEQRKRREALEDYERKQGIQARYRDDRTSRMKEADALGLTGEERREFMRGGGQTINVNSGPEFTPLQEQLAKKDADFYQATRDGAVSAGRTLQQINALEQVMSAANTGKIEQAKALAGQYFGTQAGANLQAFQGISRQMVLSAAEQLSGAMSDGDIKLLEDSLPQFGNDPRANKVVTDLLRKAAENQVAEFDRVQQYIQENNGTLQGFKPSFLPKPADVQGGMENSQPRSREEVMAEYGVNF